MALVTVTSSGAEPRSYEINKPRIVFGRDSNNSDVHLDNLAISKNHCEIVKDDQGYLLRDLKSSNKTYVNGKEIQEHRLSNGDEIVVGNFKMTFSGAVAVESRPKPVAEDSFEPTLQLPPEMIRKKMEEMQREKEQGVSATRAAAATTAKRPTASSSQDNHPATSQNAQSGSGSGNSNMAVIIVVGAIIAVIVVNVIIALRQH